MDKTPEKRKESIGRLHYMGLPGFIPPQAIDIEEAILGAILLEPHCLVEIKSILRPDSFYKNNHREIFSTIIEMDSDNRPIDILTVTYELKRNNKLDEVGGPHLITSLTNRVTSSKNVVSWCCIIAERYLERKLIEIGGQVQKDVVGGGKDTLVLLEQVKQTFYDLDASGTIRSKSINCNMEPTAHKDILTLNGRRILSMGNVGTLVAPPGSGKSQICEAMCAANINPMCDTFGFKVLSVAGDGGVLYVDTERSWNDAIAGIHRIKMRVDVKKNPSLLRKDGVLKGLIYESMVGVPTISQRKALLESIIRKGNEGAPFRLIIIDGITDFVEDVNDAKEGPGIIAWLISMSNRYNTAVFTTIHDNPAINKNKARGTVGSELGRKSESMMLLKRVAEDKNIRQITMDFEYGKNRNDGDSNLDSFIVWSDDQKMMVSADFTPTQRSGEGVGFKQIMDEIFGKFKSMTGVDLRKKYCLMTGKSDKTAQRHIGDCVKMNILDYDDNTKIYRLSGDIPF